MSVNKSLIGPSHAILSIAVWTGWQREAVMGESLSLWEAKLVILLPQACECESYSWEPPDLASESIWVTEPGTFLLSSVLKWRSSHWGWLTLHPGPRTGSLLTVTVLLPHEFPVCEVLEGQTGYLVGIPKEEGEPKAGRPLLLMLYSFPSWVLLRPRALSCVLIPQTNR